MSYIMKLSSIAFNYFTQRIFLKIHYKILHVTLLKKYYNTFLSRHCIALCFDINGGNSATIKVSK